MSATVSTSHEYVHEGAPPDRTSTWRTMFRFAFVFAQLMLLVVVIRQFQIESSAFLRIFILAVAGFAVHYFLPSALRQPFFVALSITGIFLVLGTETASALIGVGMVLIGICHLPVSWRIRIALLLGSGAALAVLRVQDFDSPWTHALWPILGSMFMFRLAVYVYDLRHDKQAGSLWSTLAYFFMLPNVCFPLFPVVDYKTFYRNHATSDLYEIAQLGVIWIVRGVFHLVLYRIVYYHFTLPPHEVVDANSLVQFLISNFLLYLRISGHFHIIIGILHLFGFGLPETHNRYVLSSSFTEFWRRINIYWKDFMMKVFYYPIYFRLRSWGATRALICATACVFLVTWVAHSYQWFWLRGTFPLIWQDAVFWTVLAVLVVINSLRELKHGRKRSLQASRWTPRDSILHGVKTVGTFTTIVLLWSLWTSESFASWRSMWSFLSTTNATGAGFPSYLLLAIAMVFGGAVLWGRNLKGVDSRSKPLFVFMGVCVTRATARALALLCFLAIIGLPQVYTEFGVSTANFVLSVRADRLSRVDSAKLHRGYYEDLTRVDRFNSKLWEVYMTKPMNWLDVTGSGLTRLTGDFAVSELIPDARSTTSFSVVTTNRWGMRDQDYTKIVPEKTYRLAVLGASAVMGWGVEDDEPFETVFEHMLNEKLATESSQRFESLNFGVPGYYPPQQLPNLVKALQFSPHGVLYIATGRELSRAAYFVAETLTKGREIPYPPLRDIVTSAGVNSTQTQTEAMRRLAEVKEDILAWLYQELVERCKTHGAEPIFVFIPHVEKGTWEKETAPTLEIARAAGFLVWDLSDVYGNRGATMKIAEWDDHPNARAHRLIAEQMLQAFKEKWPALRSQLK